jgi:ABC-2 type transport system ATP-binding protein
MISVDSLTKTYADAEAVSSLTFSVQKGEILGLLGPNGAGKTTTMRMLTCYLPPTSGTATVAGYDIYEQSLDVRRNVGYLPENVPLYGEMRVDEYLRFRARLKGVPRGSVTSRLDYVVGRCGLGEVRQRVIDHLSKGYRQRVGLADALLHNPPILILDEPTVGLDPNQIRQVRELIRDLGSEHTIILSSHILPEIEQVCGRVLIISRGRIVAQDTPDALRQEIGGTSRIEVELAGGPREAVVGALGALPGVRTVAEAAGAGAAVRVSLECEAAADPREAIFRLAVNRGWVLLGLARRQRTLEDVFINLTTREGDLFREAESGAGDAPGTGDDVDAGERFAPPDGLDPGGPASKAHAGTGSPASEGPTDEGSRGQGEGARS